MHSLQGFSDAAAPVFSDLGKAAPSLTDATRTLTPFSEATTVALKSLGETGEASGPIFREAEPVVRKAAVLAKSGVVPTTELAKLFTSLKKTKGWDGLVELIYNSTATLNGFDQYGHFGRTLVTLTNCLDYEPAAVGASGCVANFNGPNAGASSSASSADLYRLLQSELTERTGGTVAAPGSGAGPTTGLGSSGAVEGEAGVAGAAKTGGTAPLLDYLLGP